MDAQTLTVFSGIGLLMVLALAGVYIRHRRASRKTAINQKSDKNLEENEGK